MTKDIPAACDGRCCADGDRCGCGAAVSGLTILSRYDTVHGVDYVLASEAEAEIAARVAAERERCAAIAESWATEETATTCANVASAIRGAQLSHQRPAGSAA